jgi:hypothetical protein
MEYNFRPFRILGLRATYTLLYQIYTTIFTVTCAVIQKFYNNSKEDTDDL